MKNQTTHAVRTLVATGALLTLLVAASAAQDAATKRPADGVGAADVASGGHAVANRFAAYDLVVDTADWPLAAWQVELQCRQPAAQIVGIEGGDHTAFADPPHYDPRAMNQQRVILAAFSTAEELPLGRIRIARVHVQIPGPQPCEFDIRLVVIATLGGEPIDASVSLQESEN